MTSTGLAIIGLAVQFGPFEGLAAFERAMYAGSQGTRWPDAPGAPAPLDLGLRLAAGALADAGMAAGDRVAVVVGLWPGGGAGEGGPQAGAPGSSGARGAARGPDGGDAAREVAERIALTWGLGALRVGQGAGAMDAGGGLALAAGLLEAGEAEAVLLVTVDLAYAAGPPAPDAPCQTLSFDRRAGRMPAGAGGGAVLLTGATAPRAAGRRVYGVVEALGHVPPITGGASPGTVLAAARAALAGAAVDPRDVGYLELHASGAPDEDAAEVGGLGQAYRSGAPEPTCAIGSAKAHVGHPGAAAGMAALARTVLCLYHRYLPGAPGWTGPREPAAWEGTPFYVPSESRPWVPPLGQRRRAGISLMDPRGGCTHLLVSEGPPPGRRARYLPARALHLLSVVGDDGPSLLAAVDRVRADLATHPDPDRLAARLHDEAVARPAGLALALVGRDRGELLREAGAARQGLPAALVAGGVWQSPRGSYFTVRPLGDRGSVAFVYPGAFSVYPGVGRESLRLFPATMEGLTDLTADLADVLALQLLYPRSMTSPSLQHQAALEARLTADVPAMIAAGMAYAVLYTRIVRQVFGVQPSAALGYSLGEVSMLLALGVWKGDVGTSSVAFRASPLFRTRLAGPLESVREFWAHCGHRASDDDQPWAAYILLASPAAVERAIEQPPRVFLAIVNAPGEVVVGGDPAACVRLADRLGCERVRLPFPQVLHCPPAETEWAELARINRFPVRPVPGVALTCSASEGPPEVERDALAECIATMASRRLDFVRLVERVYGEGARIFVELGPGSTCTRLIDSILGGREHLAAAIDRRGVDDHGSLFRLLAKLVSHRVRLDLSALAPPTGPVA